MVAAIHSSLSPSLSASTQLASPLLTKRTRVLITLLGISAIAALMLMLLAHVSHNPNPQVDKVVVATVPYDTRKSVVVAPQPPPSLSSSSTSLRRTYHILAYGDSLTAGVSGHERFPYSNYLMESLQFKNNASVQYRGMPGWTTEQMVQIVENEQQPTSLYSALHNGSFHIDVVLLLAGTNDLAYGFTADHIVQNLIQLHQYCSNNHVAHTVAIAIPPSAYQASVDSAAILAASINQKLKLWSEQVSRVTFVPFPFEYNKYNDKNITKLWHTDQLHFSELGYRMLGTSLAPIVDEILQKLDSHGNNM